MKLLIYVRCFYQIMNPMFRTKSLIFLFQIVRNIFLGRYKSHTTLCILRSAIYIENQQVCKTEKCVNSV